ncbi:hypothetical protein HDU96_011146 [Phlyctochytrium bullatum]|nr:hypothetical protein HDU96_011146 [Phlyctochytrium bullatum]
MALFVYWVFLKVIFTHDALRKGFGYFMLTLAVVFAALRLNIGRLRFTENSLGSPSIATAHSYAFLVWGVADLVILALLVWNVMDHVKNRVPQQSKNMVMTLLLMKLYGETIELASQFPTLTRHPTVLRRRTLPRSILAQIDTPTAPSSSSPPLIVEPNLRSSTNVELYIQRPVLIAAIDAAFRSGRRICVHHGPGGTGKSFLGWARGW